MAGFSKGCGLVFDAYGTCCGMMAYTYKDGYLQRLEHWKDRYLLGAGYHRIGILAKEICNTNLLDVAGKVMGLQAYGTPVADWVRYFEDRYFRSSAEYGYDDYIRQWFATTSCGGLFPGGLTTGSRSVNEKDYCNLVASMQQAFTSIIVDSVNRLIEETRLPRVFLSGGCAMNIISNAAVAAQPRVESLFVQPNCGDVGQAMGAAILAMRAISGIPLHRPEIAAATRRNPYLGPTLIDDPADSELPDGVLRSPFNQFNVNDRTTLARRLIAGEIIGVVTGRSEIGPRALGNRSIFAHAAFPEMKDVINQRIKHREWWRPFAPVCRIDDATKYFQMRSPSRYMLMNDVVLEQWRAKLEAVTHIDGTARVQVLENREDNIFLWDLLSAISAQGAVPLLLNTSFNLNRKPLVNSSAEAVKLLSNSEMDAAVVGEFIFEKRARPGCHSVGT
ncbi:MAG: carbamoyltransferase [Verrucomicrobiota bacterium]